MAPYGVWGDAAIDEGTLRAFCLLASWTFDSPLPIILNNRMATQLVTLPVATVAVANTAVRVYTGSTPYFVTSVSLQAEFTNVGNIFIGDSSVTSSNGIIVPPGDVGQVSIDSRSNQVEEFDLRDIWINSATSSNAARVIAMRRTA